MASDPSKQIGKDTCDPIPHTRAIMDYLHRTAILQPSRSGGGDHSMRAGRAGVDPMIFGGKRYQHDGLCDPRRSMLIRRIVQAGGWIARRDWSYHANYAAAGSADVCLGMVTA